MMKTMKITSLQNDRIKKLIRLRDKRGRDTQELFLIEGARNVQRAFDAGVEFNEIYTCPEAFKNAKTANIYKAVAGSGVPVVELTLEVNQKISYRKNSEGILAIAAYPQKKLDSLKITENPFLIVAQTIEKPGNLGTIIRSADGANVDGVIVCDRCTDLYNPNVITASTGMIFHQNIVEAESAEVAKFLQEHNIIAVSASPDAEINYTDFDFTQPVAIIVGAEHEGVSDFWNDGSFQKVRIPMEGHADSLNVSAATTLILYEVLRQRNM